MWVTTIDVMFVPNFMKMCHLV